MIYFLEMSFEVIIDLYSSYIERQSVEGIVLRLHVVVLRCGDRW